VVNEELGGIYIVNMDGLGGGTSDDDRER